MIVDILFMCGLYLLGLFPLLYLRRGNVVEFIGWTAFAWGSLVWVVASVVCLVASLDVSLLNIFLVIVVCAALFGWWQHARLARPRPGTVRRIALPATLFMLVVIAGGSVDRAILSPDSVVQILVANSLINVPHKEIVVNDFGLWGPALISLQASAAMLGRDYFDTLQPAFFITLVGTFAHVARSSLLAIGLTSRRSVSLSLVATLLVGSTPLVLVYALYPHNNIIVAMYLLIGVSAFWMALKQRQEAFFYLGIMAFLGMSLARTETSLFAGVFLICMVSMGSHSRREWLRGLAPYTGILLGWNLWLLLRVAPETHILTPERVVLILVVVGGVLALVSLLRVAFVKKRLAPNLHRLMLGSLVAALIAILVLDSYHLPRMLYVFGFNMFAFGTLWWGGTWWLLVILAVLIPRKVQVPNERLFTVGIAGFFLLLLLISYAHPFRLGWGDSANRAFLHILPVVIYFLTLKVGTALAMAKTPAS